MKKIQSKMKALEVVTRLYIDFFRRSRAAYSVVSGRFLPKFVLIQLIIKLLWLSFFVTCKNEEDPIKNEGVQW